MVEYKGEAVEQVMRCVLSLHMLHTLCDVTHSVKLLMLHTLCYTSDVKHNLLHMICDVKHNVM